MAKKIKTRSQQNTHRVQLPEKQSGPSRAFWQSPILWLVVLPVLVYAKIVFFDFTALDDQFFVIDHAAFNQDLGNLFKVFNQGLFVPKNDIYYRPVFLIDMILENHLFGIKPWGYHLLSLIFHLISVCLLFIFLKRIRIPETPAFLLALFFAVCPVLTQTVAWIPGRNDLLLMIFLLSSLICVIEYFRTREMHLFAAQFITFLLALLTKETAVIFLFSPSLSCGLFFQLKFRRCFPPWHPGFWLY